MGGYGEEPGALPPQRSGLVTALAVLNFVFGGLAIVCGLLGLLGGALLSGGGSTGKEIQRQVEKQLEKEGVQVPGGTVQDLGKIIMFQAVLSLLWGTGAIVGGVGLISRRNWGRILTLVCAGVSALLALLSLWQVFQGGGVGAIVNVLIYIFYAAFAFIVLLNPQVNREFS
jgi:hypothetical protein